MLQKTTKTIYGQLENIFIKNKSTKDITMLIGDFNAKVGKENEGLKGAMGKKGLGIRNENGEKFIDFCVRQGITIGGTLFPHKDIHKATWVSPDERTKNQIDHICISNKFRRSLLDVKVMRGADVDSDHYLLIAKIQLKLKKIQNPKELRTKFDTSKLKEEHKIEEFILTLRNRFNALQEEENVNDIQEIPDIIASWEKNKNIFNSTSKDILGPKRHEIKPWISNISLSLIEERRKIKEKILTAIENEKGDLKNECREFNKKIKKSVRKDKRKYTEGLANQAEEAMNKNNLKDL